MEAILYFFSFGHHGKFSSYKHVTDYLGEQIKVDVTIQLPRWLPDQIAWPVESISRIFSEYRLLPYYQSNQRRIFHYLYPENSLFQGNRWRKNHQLILSCHQSPSFLAYMIKKGKSPGFFEGVKTANAVIVLSQNLIKDYQQSLPGCNIISIPHGVDVEFFKPSYKFSTEKRILTVGNWLRDYELWGEVVKQIMSARKDIRFDVIATPSILSKLKPYAFKYPDHINLWSGISDDDLVTRYHNASVLFLPLKDAIANNALLEGMACGLPVVVTDLPATREYGGDAATYINTRDADQYVAHLLRILDDQKLRIKLSMAAREEILRFSWAIVADQFRNLYDSL
jgi:glycosyltransferase involved in cell wall biosynthesis